MKTKVKFIGTSRYNEWSEGDTGYIDGYVQGGDDRPYCVVVLDNVGTIVLALSNSLVATGFLTINQ